jgi:hypothetical protein
MAVNQKLSDKPRADEIAEIFDSWVRDNGFETIKRTEPYVIRCAVNILDSNVGLLLLEGDKITFHFAAGKEYTITGNVYEPYAFGEINKGLKRIIHHIDNHRIHLLDLENFLMNRGFGTQIKTTNLFNRDITVWVSVQWKSYKLGGILVQPDCSYRITASEHGSTLLKFSKEESMRHNTKREIYNHFCSVAWGAHSRALVSYSDICDECGRSPCSKCGMIDHEYWCDAQ